MAKKPEPKTPEELRDAMLKEAEFLWGAADYPGSAQAVKMHYRRASSLMRSAAMFMDGVFARDRLQGVPETPETGVEK